MNRIWSPWRYQYVQKTSAEESCIFCRMAAEHNDDSNFIVFRGSCNFIVLNLFPYTVGHMLIVPYDHVDSLECASQDTLEEMILLARQTERHLRAVYKPAGLNIGLNLGEAAGAGIAGHIHMHVLPRWTGDANFMTTIAETRVLPEELPVTYRKLKDAFEGSSTP
jgi:ATP adenylyltransferase